MAHVFQVGAGSGGIVVLDLLARDPRITKVTLVEPDIYKLHNVHRHLFPSSSVGRPKGELAAEWLRDRRPELSVEVLAVDLTAPDHQAAIEQAAAACDVGVCAADNEPAKYHFDHLMRRHGKPWSLGEVLSGGIAGWVHRFPLDGPCYGCVASYLQRGAPSDPAAPDPDYADPNGQVRETTIPASKASIDVVASLHALMTLDLLSPSPHGGEGEKNGDEFTSLLFTLTRVPGVFDEPYRAHKFRIPRSLTCLICSAVPAPPGEDLDAALDQALSRLGHV
ncbi:MAG TPA: ThiF family adenylyltransferase [Fimbriiglobus sp.]|jgi:molybdopterin/thiamine biosynthesis adenylyltransferase|nr:ThiF family adenylyltransferase [Fimbriiglobus sp.]